MGSSLEIATEVQISLYVHICIDDFNIDDSCLFMLELILKHVEKEFVMSTLQMCVCVDYELILHDYQVNMI